MGITISSIISENKEEIPKESYVAEEFRENVIIVKFNRHFKFLKILKENPYATYEELKSKIHLSGGVVYNALKDMRTMGLIIPEGRRNELTELGELWLNNCTHKGNVSPEVLKKVCLSIPLFNRVYIEIPHLYSYKEIFQKFSLYAPPNFDNKIIGSVTRRYLEGIHGINVKKRMFNLVTPEKHKKYPIYHATPGSGAGGGEEIHKKKFTIEEYAILESSIKELKEEYGEENILFLLKKK